MTTRLRRRRKRTSSGAIRMIENNVYNRKDKSANLWEGISCDDYNRHMKDPAVFQSQTLGEIFKECVQEIQPKSVLVLGCTDGNGFEHIDENITRTVTGIDINKSFLDKCFDRFGKKKYALKLVCCDFEKDDCKIETVDFVSCALFLEYVDIEKTFDKIKSIMKPTSVLNIVIQRNNDNEFVSETGIKSLESLAAIAAEINQAKLCSYLEKSGITVESSEIYNLPNGKDLISYCCQVSA